MNIVKDPHGSLHWTKASACGATTCVEVAPLTTGVAVRDSKQVDGPILSISAAAWNACLRGAKMGDFDHLAL